MLPRRLYTGSICAVMAALFACHGDDLVSSSTGSVEVRVTTIDAPADTPGYTLRIDTTASNAVAVQDTVELSDVPAGSHKVELTGIRADCRLEGDSPRTVSVTVGGKIGVDFRVICTSPRWRVFFEALREGNEGSLGNLQGEIFRVKPDGSGLTNFTNNPYDDVDPALSPDFSKVAFASARDDYALNIYVQKANGAGLTQLTTGFGTAFAPAWSPDGAKIAFIRGQSLHVMNADGTDDIELTDHVANPFSWSPDSRHLAAAVGPDVTHRDIWLFPVDGSTATQLTSDVALEIEPAWSPDGRQIAFTRRTTVSSGTGLYYDNLWLMNADGTGQVQLTRATYTTTAPTVGASRSAWSPAGERILFQSDDDLYTIRPDGTGLTNLTNSPDASESSGSWSPTGTQIVFRRAVAGAQPDVFIMNADGSGMVNLSNDPGFEQP